jgi:predicted Zn-dependent protease with MMP-like domain
MVRKGNLPYRRFERLVKRAMATIPEEFQGFLENVVVEMICLALWGCMRGYPL